MGDLRKPYFRLMPKTHMGGGVVRFMVAAEGHAMIRRPKCMPFLVSVNEWNSWPECDARAHLLTPESDNG